MAFYVPPSCDQVDFDLSGLYTPTICDGLNFDIGGSAPHQILSHQVDIVLQVPSADVFDGDLIEINNVSLVLDPQESLIDLVWPIASDNADVILDPQSHTIRILPDIIIDDVELILDPDSGQVRTPMPQDLPFAMSPGGRIAAWGGFGEVHSRKCFSWEEGIDIYKVVGVPCDSGTHADNETCSSWVSLDWKDGIVSIPSGDFKVLDDLRICSPWITLFFTDEHGSPSWGGKHAFVDESPCVSWNEPGSHDVKKCAPWTPPNNQDDNFCVAWGEPGEKDAEHCSPWGPFSYYTLCYDLPYTPPLCGAINFKFPNKYELVPNICEGIQFHLNMYSSTDPRCPYDHWHTGTRDRYPNIEVLPETSFPAARQVYYMLNSVFVKELITNTPIEVLGVSAVIDRDSWLWQFQVTVGSRDCLEIIRPRNGVYINILIEINGYQWICTVEGWSENRTFGSDTWTITGRSPSLMFASPVSAQRSNTIATGNQGAQLFDNVVTSKVLPPNWPAQLGPWVSDWSTYQITGGTQTGFDPYSAWYVPANTLSYNDQDEITIMKSVTDSIGAYIQTDPVSNIFHVKPMYAHQPWNWLSSNQDINWLPIIEAQFSEVARHNELKPYYQAIHILGESAAANVTNDGPDPLGQSIFVNVYKEGYSGGTATYAPMVTDALLTTSKAALERGRMVIGETAEWVFHTIKLNVLCPAPSNMGLFLPGDMLVVLERGYPWRGQCTSIRVDATSDGKGFGVTQTLDVEEYAGD